MVTSSHTIRQVERMTLDKILVCTPHNICTATTNTKLGTKLHWYGATQFWRDQSKDMAWWHWNWNDQRPCFCMHRAHNHSVLIIIQCCNQPGNIRKWLDLQVLEQHMLRIDRTSQSNHKLAASMWILMLNTVHEIALMVEYFSWSV